MGSRYADEADFAGVAEALAEEDEQQAEAPVAEDPETPDEDEGSDDEEEVGEEPAAEAEGTEEEHPDEPMFTVKIDGTDVEVPQSELVKGYMRTQDYTRKTQLLGAQRRQLEDATQLMQALDNNPAATLKVLARHYRVEDYEPDEGDQGPSEEQVRLAKLEQQMQAELMRQRESAVNAELDRLHREYGDFDEDALFSFAVERNVQDLETALRAMTYGQVAAKRRTEKRQMAAVSGGGGLNGAARPKAPPEKIEKFADAYAAAKRELDMGN